MLLRFGRRGNFGGTRNTDGLIKRSTSSTRARRKVMNEPLTELTAPQKAIFIGPLAVCHGNR